MAQKVTYFATVFCNAGIIQSTDFLNGTALCKELAKYLTVGKFWMFSLFCHIFTKNLAVCRRRTVFSPSYVHMAVTRPYAEGKLDDVMYPWPPQDKRRVSTAWAASAVLTAFKTQAVAWS